MPPPLPFPYPLRIGTDICRVGRIERILRSVRGPRFVQRLLSPEERVGMRADPIGATLGALLAAAPRGEEPPDAGRGSGVVRRVAVVTNSGNGPGLNVLEKVEESLVHRTATFIAGRWAAKEAVFKAHPQFQRLGFHDVQIVSPAGLEKQGMASANRYFDEAERFHAGPMALIKPGNGRRDQTAMVSISHDGDYATAVCIGVVHARGESEGERPTEDVTTG